MLNILGALLALGILVTVHEGGHFLAARLFGVEVEKFSIGFGKKIFGFTRGKTEYLVSLIPLGGYVKMKGENPDEVNDLTNPEEGSFASKAWWQRAGIAFAGPFANLLFAFLIFISSFLVGRNIEDQMPVIGKITGVEYEQFKLGDRVSQVNDKEVLSWSQIVQNIKNDELNSFAVERNGVQLNIILEETTQRDWYDKILPFSPAKIGEVQPGMPAYEAGLMQGDEILFINSEPVKNWYMMREMILASEDEVNLRIKRNDQEFEKQLKLSENPMDGSKIIGISQWLPVKLKETFSLWESVKYGTITTVSFTILNYSAIGKMVANPKQLKDNVGGPIMMYTMSKQSSEKGLSNALGFIAAISIVLMIMNLLPIPVLDGGHIFFCFLEGIFRKPLSLKVQIALQNVGLMLLMSLMIFAFWSDISRLFLRTQAIKQQTESVQAE